MLAQFLSILVVSWSWLWKVESWWKLCCISLHKAFGDCMCFAVLDAKTAVKVALAKSVEIWVAFCEFSGVLQKLSDWAQWLHLPCTHLEIKGIYWWIVYQWPHGQIQHNWIFNLQETIGSKTHMNARHAISLSFGGVLQGELRGQTKKKGQTEPNLQFFFPADFADFRFSWEWQHLGSADFRRKPQETADFRGNRLVPFSLSLLIRPSFVWKLVVPKVTRCFGACHCINTCWNSIAQHVRSPAIVHLHRKQP